ncbi:diguanylate cyclase [Castellaniella sp.]|uniref:diguanylate cyclase n=1 Tax=Castellaniella sp. TaxID=1955812 RepID=UPI00355DC8B1
MVRKHLFFFFLLLAIYAGTLAIERIDRVRHAAQATQQVQQRLEAGTRNLEAYLLSLVEINERLAEALAVAEGDEIQPFDLWTAELHRQHPELISQSWIDGLSLRRVAPPAGNEGIVDLDYGRHPEYMGGIQRMLARRGTILDPVPRLLQTGRPGVLLRSPFYRQDDKDRYRGHVVLSLDWHGMLQRQGLAGDDVPFELQIRQEDADGVEHLLHGPVELPVNHRSETRLELPDQVWWLRAVPSRTLAAYPAAWAGLIRVLGLLLALAVLALWWRHSGTLHKRLRRLPRDGLTSLRTFILLAVLVPLPIIAGLTGWWVYGASIRAVRILEEQQVTELGGLIRGRLASAFGIPGSVLTFNQGQWHGRLIQARDPAAMLDSFMLQLRAQPHLTLLGFAREDGRFWAASRTWQGGVSSLRILESDMRLDGRMRKFHVDDANRHGPLESLGDRYVDMRSHARYRSAADTPGLHWNLPDPYALQDAAMLYEDWGIGMSLQLRDAQGQPTGVLMADVALAQINELLRDEMAPLSGLAWLTLPDGTLLAASSPQALGQPMRDGFMYTQAVHSPLPEVRQGMEWIHESRESTGQYWMRVDGVRTLLHWRSLELPNGPRLQLALALPEDRYTESIEGILLRIGLLVMGFWLMGTLLAFGLAWWFSRPLRELSVWAEQLAHDQSGRTEPVHSPVREIATLSRALSRMARHMQAHASQLEQQVAERTEALTLANARLQALSLTDGLTGLANRRHFDQVLAKEWARARRSGEPLSLLMLDVDYFKAYNDRYGHQAGDQVLSRLAAVLQAALQRPADLAARYGGEEFAVIVPGLDVAAAGRLADTVRRKIQDLGIVHPLGVMGRLTISIGVAQQVPGHLVGVEDLIRRADDALYQAKRAGRNRVIVAGQA